MHGEHGFGLLETVVAVVIIAVLATIAMIIYQQTAARGYVEEGIELANPVAQAATVYYEETGVFPKSNQAAGIVKTVKGRAISSVRLVNFQGGRIKITFTDESGITVDGKGAHLVLKPFVRKGIVTWRCAKREGNVPRKYLPHQCQ